LRPPPCIAATWLTGDRCVPSRQRHLSGCCARHTTARPSTARAPSNAFAAAAPERVANAPALAVASSRCAAAVAVRAWAWRARRAFLCGSALQMMLADPRRVMLLRTFLQRRDGATPARFAVAASRAHAAAIHSHVPPPHFLACCRRCFGRGARAAPSSCRPARTQTPTCTSAMRPPPRPSGGWAQSTVLSPRHAAPKPSHEHRCAQTATCRCRTLTTPLHIIPPLQWHYTAAPLPIARRALCFSVAAAAARVASARARGAGRRQVVATIGASILTRRRERHKRKPFGCCTPLHRRTPPSRRRRPAHSLAPVPAQLRPSPRLHPLLLFSSSPRLPLLLVAGGVAACVRCPRSVVARRHTLSSRSPVLLLNALWCHRPLSLFACRRPLCCAALSLFSPHRALSSPRAALAAASRLSLFACRRQAIPPTGSCSGPSRHTNRRLSFVSAHPLDSAPASTHSPDQHRAPILHLPDASHHPARTDASLPHDGPTADTQNRYR